MYLHFASRHASFGGQKAAITELRKIHRAFADYGTRTGGGKRLHAARLEALFADDGLVQACARARKLHEACEQSDCDHQTAPGQACKIEGRDPSSPLHELFTLLGLDIIAPGTDQID